AAIGVMVAVVLGCTAGAALVEVVGVGLSSGFARPFASKTAPVAARPRSINNTNRISPHLRCGTDCIDSEAALEPSGLGVGGTEEGTLAARSMPGGVVGIAAGAAYIGASSAIFVVAATRAWTADTRAPQPPQNRESGV